MTTNGKPVWVDFGSTDFAASKAFYEQLFGWTFTDAGPDMGHYHLIHAGEDLVGGAMDVAGMTCPDGAPIPSAWGVFLGTDDADATVRRAEAAGGRVVEPAHDASTSGRFAVLLDPTGAAISAWQAGDITAFDFSGKPGTPAWFELMTQDFDASVAFYTEAFGLDAQPLGTPMEDADDTRYVTHGAGESAAYGICDAHGWIPADMGSFWRAYFVVDGCDAAIERVKELGGSLLAGPDDSPFGRIATVEDPAGASFQLVSPSESVTE